MSNCADAPGRVPVLLPLPLKGVLDYGVPAGLAACPGSIVQVTLNRRPHFGVVWDGNCGSGIAPTRLKLIERIVPGFRIERPLRQFVDWVANYTLAPSGDVLAMALRPNALAGQPALKLVRRSSALPDGRLTPMRQRVLDALADQLLPPATVARAAGVSIAMIQTMLRSGWLEPVMVAASESLPSPQHLNRTADLSADQSVAAEILSAAAAVRCNSVTLLQGATGSGKTEVYFEAIRSCLNAGRQALVLLPEIALSTQVLARFEQRFGAAAAVWHSDLPARTRRDTWQAAADGRGRVVVGARSALFLPFADLGLIVVDEEHESSFKQEDGVIYHARDMAVVRGRLSQAAVVLASATPSLETVANVEAGRYARVDLAARFGGATMPSIEAVDLRRHPPDRGAFLSPPLLSAIGETLDRGQQVMLFLNRRGYAPLTLCRACGFRIHCPDCTAWLVEHRLRRTLVCHYCGHTESTRLTCPSCKTDGSLAAVGPGVERISEEAAIRFPTARQLVMVSDTLTGPRATAAAALAVESRQVDIIIGTQVAAKGWHFPHLTLVGVVDADLGLAGGDLRAGERTVQLLNQVAGRAGRVAAAGRVLLQTYQPNHPVMQALIAGDLAGFMRTEAEQRRQGQWPPYGRLAALIISASTGDDADGIGRALAMTAPHGAGIEVLGPAPAPLALLRGRHRRRFLLRTEKGIAVQPLLLQWLAQVHAPRSVRITVDVDPCSFL